MNAIESVQIGNVTVRCRRTPWGLIAIIDPHTARALLTQNDTNRRQRVTRVSLYARDIPRWALNGQTITFESDGTIVDGQHRLEACIQADAEFETYIVGDIDPAVRHTVDTGLPRTLGDVLEFDHEADGRTLASILSLSWRIDQNGTLLSGAGYQSPTRSDLAEYLLLNPGIRQSLPVATAASKALRLPKSVGGGLHFQMARRSDVEASAFWEQVIHGDGLRPNVPAFVLRAQLIRQMGAPRRAEVADVAVWTIKAWNAYRRKANVSTLRWRRAGSNPESFPKVA
jgi:hypothetical protein